MNKIKCPNCGKEISNEEDFCYYCGYVINENFSPTELPHKQPQITANTYEDNNTIFISKLLKTLSLLLVVFGLLDFILLCIDHYVLWGLVVLLGTMTICSIIYGIGEIIQILKNIELKK